MNQKNLAILKNYMKNYWPHKIVEKYAPLSWIDWVKSADKSFQNCQVSVFKVTAGMIKLCDSLLQTEK